MLLLLTALSTPAFAGDDFFFVGGGAAIRPGFGPVLYPGATEASGFSLWGEAEADARFQAGIVSGRFDLDFTGTVLPDLSIVHALPDVPGIDTVRPEWAMIQAGGETWVARGGIVNAAFGLEDWDDWALYLPTHGQYFAASPGRMLGSEVGWAFDGGPSVAIGGGVDLDFDSEPIIEANVTYEADAFSVYSGIATYPATLQQYEAVLGAEAYPAEFLTLALGGLAGVSGKSPFAEVSLYGVFLPSGMVSPVVRLEGSFDPGGAAGGAPWAASVGGAVKPVEWVKILVEGKILGTAGEPVPGVYASLCVFRPEPAEDEAELEAPPPSPDEKN